MIEQKSALAERIVGTGEGWITEMSTEQLRDVIALSADSVGDELMPPTHVHPVGHRSGATAATAGGRRRPNPYRSRAVCSHAVNAAAIGDTWWSQRFIVMLEIGRFRRTTAAGEALRRAPAR